jgi:hypothetical protein
MSALTGRWELGGQRWRRGAAAAAVAMATALAAAVPLVVADAGSARAAETTTSTTSTTSTSCIQKISTSDVSAKYTDDFHAVVAYTGATPLCEGASMTISLNSYQVEGSTWPTSGEQSFVDHDAVTLDSNHLSGSLEVTQPSCYYQTDLYWGGTRFDGVDGSVPHFDDVRISGLIDHRNGGHACQPETVPPSGSFTVACSSTGDTVSIGNLSSGTDSAGHFELVVNGVAQTAQSGQTGIAVAAQATLVLRYVASDASMTTLDTRTAPAACPTTTPVTTPVTTVATTATTASQQVSVLPTKKHTSTPTTSVLGTKAGSELPHTGNSLPVTALVVISLVLLAGGGALVAAPALARSRKPRRH